jgi:Ulp1 family protease
MTSKADRALTPITDSPNDELTVGKLQDSLRPRTDMSDAVLHAYMYLLTQRDPARFQYWGPHFLVSLIRPDDDEHRGYKYSRVSRHSRKNGVKTMELEKLFLPVHFKADDAKDTAAHFVLAVINISGRQFEWYDPARNATVYPHAEILGHFRKYLIDEAAQYSPDVKHTIESWPVYISKDAPVQQDNFSCGIFTCMFAEILGAGRHLAAAFGMPVDDVSRHRSHILENLLANQIK